MIKNLKKLLPSSLPLLTSHFNQIQLAFTTSSNKPQTPSNSKINAYFRLCRYHQPIGAMLLYWPTAWGVLAGASAFMPTLYFLGLFLMGSWTSRSAGCIVNDYLDRDFDSKVERTKDRPLASGEVSTREAGGLLFANLCGGLVVLFHLPMPALLFTFSVVALAAVYPLAKRYTNYPQLVLGFGFNSGVIIGALTGNVSIPLAPILALYSAGISWTMVYDTVYAYQDIEDDEKVGVMSTARKWKQNPKEILERWCWGIVLCHGSLALFDVNYFYPSLLMIGMDLLLIRQIQKIDLKDKKACGNFFRKNNLYGLGIFASLILLNWIRFLQMPSDKEKVQQKEGKVQQQSNKDKEQKGQKGLEKAKEKKEIK